jgi:hypothetical protein
MRNLFVNLIWIVRPLNRPFITMYQFEVILWIEVKQVCLRSENLEADFNIIRDLLRTYGVREYREDNFEGKAKCCPHTVTQFWGKSDHWPVTCHPTSVTKSDH